MNSQIGSLKIVTVMDIDCGVIVTVMDMGCGVTGVVMDIGCGVGGAVDCIVILHFA